MVKVLILEQDDFWVKIQNFFKERKHSVNWCKRPEEIREIYANQPQYDLAMVSGVCD